MTGGGEPSFEIPVRPRRRYSSRTVEYEGGTVFRLRPRPDLDEQHLTDRLEALLEEANYRYGDWFDLPQPLFLVHDPSTDDTFRVAVRDGSVELHVLPETEPPGLRGLYERLSDGTDVTWSVTRRIEHVGEA